MHASHDFLLLDIDRNFEACVKLERGWGQFLE